MPRAWHVHMCSQGMHVTGYSPLGTPDSASITHRDKEVPLLLKDPIVMAIAEKHNKQPAQVPALLLLNTPSRSVATLDEVYDERPSMSPVAEGLGCIWSFGSVQIFLSACMGSVAGSSCGTSLGKSLHCRIIVCSMCRAGAEHAARRCCCAGASSGAHQSSPRPLRCPT